MNKFLRAAYCIPCGILKVSLLKIMNIKTFKGPKISMISPFTEITLDSRGQLFIGEKFKMREGSKIRVRSGGICKIGSRTSLNINNIVTCRDSITIGDDVQFSPNVQIYDHDHDYLVQGGVKSGKYKSSSITIGNNVWIGSNTVILRGTNIGNNSVIAAGSIVKGEVPDNTILLQKRQNEYKKIVSGE